MRPILLAAVALLLLPTTAMAGTYCARAVDDCSSQWPRCIQRCVRWAQNHTYRLPEHEGPSRVYGYERREAEERWERRDPATERGEFCKDNTVRVVGGAHLSQEGAINDAVRQWQSTVRYDHGEKFMSVENARGYRWRCDRASTNESVAGKVGEFITAGNGYQRRCVVAARPCMLPVAKGDKDER